MIDKVCVLKNQNSFRFSKNEKAEKALVHYNLIQIFRTCNVNLS